MIKTLARWMENVLMSVVSVLIVLALMELLFWSLDIRGVYEDRTREWWHAVARPAERLRDVSFQFRPNTEFSLNYDSNPRGYFDENNGILYHINEHGFRGPGFALEPAEGTKRLLVLGDSFAFGEGVHFEDTFCSRLETSLNARLDAEIEVLNLGVSGWGTKDEIRFFEQQGYKYKPDVVLVVYVLNDAVVLGFDMFEKFRHVYENPAFKNSYLISYFASSFSRQVAGRKWLEEMVESAATEKEAWDESFAYLAHGKKLADSLGASFGVAVFPYMYELNEGYPFKVLSDRVTAYCREAGIPVTDLFEAFEGEPYLKLWAHPSDQHPNEIAHAIAAEAIESFVFESGLL